MPLFLFFLFIFIFYILGVVLLLFRLFKYSQLQRIEKIRSLMATNYELSWAALGYWPLPHPTFVHSGPKAPKSHFKSVHGTG